VHLLPRTPLATPSGNDEQHRWLTRLAAWEGVSCTGSRRQCAPLTAGSLAVSRGVV
jgi:hypothetical protein